MSKANSADPLEMSDASVDLENSKAKKTVSRRSVMIQFATVFSIFFAIFALGWVTIAVVMQNPSLVSDLALRPTVGPDDVDCQLAGIKREPLVVPAIDGAHLHAWLFTVPGAKKIAIVNHGNAGNNTHRGYLASALSQAGVNVVLYDYRGYGVSTGKPTLQGILEDGDTMYAFVPDKLKYEPNQIIIYGESIGTAVSCHVAASHQCLGVILQSPIKSLPAAAKFVFVFLRMYPDFIFPKPRLDNLELIPTIHCPILLLHGMRDTIVSSNNSQVLFDAANQPKAVTFLPDCGHNDMGAYNSEVFRGAINKFIAGLK